MGPARSGPGRGRADQWLSRRPAPRRVRGEVAYGALVLELAAARDPGHRLQRLRCAVPLMAERRQPQGHFAEWNTAEAYRATISSTEGSGLAEPGNVIATPERLFDSAEPGHVTHPGHGPDMP